MGIEIKSVAQELKHQKHKHSCNRKRKKESCNTHSDTESNTVVNLAHPAAGITPRYVTSKPTGFYSPPSNGRGPHRTLSLYRQLL